MIKLKIKKGSTVKVITGDDRGKTGTVLDVDPFAMKVKVQGVRIQTRRNRQENTIYKEEGYLDYSNVQLADASSKKKKSKKKKTAKKKKTTKKATKKAASKSSESANA